MASMATPRTERSFSQSARRFASLASMSASKATRRCSVRALSSKAIFRTASKAKPSPNNTLSWRTASRAVTSDAGIDATNLSHATGFFALRQPLSPSTKPATSGPWPSGISAAPAKSSFKGSGCLSEASAKRRAMSLLTCGTRQTCATSTKAGSGSSRMPVQTRSGRLWSVLSCS